MPKQNAQPADLMADLQAEFKRLFPTDPPENLRVDKSMLTVLSLARRDTVVANKQASRASLTNGELYRIAGHNPKDPE